MAKGVAGLCMKRQPVIEMVSQETGSSSVHFLHMLTPRGVTSVPMRSSGATALDKWSNIQQAAQMVEPNLREDP